MSKPTTNNTPIDFFTQEHAQRYDERNKKLSAISDNLHFLTSLVLKPLPTRAHILCVGAGTGAEILPLAQAYPDWTFVALEPSLSMLNVCRERLEKAGIAQRCEFVHGYTQDLPQTQNFDAALSILVGHFVKREERLNFFKQMSDRLKKGGYLVNAEISFDLDSAEFSPMLKNWNEVQTLMGATPESLANLPKMMREVLTVLPPDEVAGFMQKSGIALPVRFFQAFMICGWYGVKK